MVTLAIPQVVAADWRHDDRPGWIPDWVGDDWDRNPYAYQTEEELMPSGRNHNLYIHWLMQMLETYLEEHGFQVMADVFLFYRDGEGRKQRIAPDMLLAPGFRLFDTSNASYDLDMEPLPVCLVEAVSPSSVERDQETKAARYARLGISEYLLLHIEDERGNLLPAISIEVWHLQDGAYVPTAPDVEGCWLLASVGV